jgi:hypothetical protein
MWRSEPKKEIMRGKERSKEKYSKREEHKSSPKKRSLELSSCLPIYSNLNCVEKITPSQKNSGINDLAKTRERVWFFLVGFIVAF